MHRIPDRHRSMTWRSSAVGIGLVVLAALGVTLVGLLVSVAVPALLVATGPLGSLLTKLAAGTG